MKKRLIASILTVAMAASLLAGCGVPKSESSSGESGDSGASGEKVFRFSTRTEPTTLDPSKGNCIPDTELQNALTERLVRTVKGEVKEGIAEKWEVSDDGLVYTFHLRDAKWSDGEPITAENFVYSWRRLMDPATAAPFAYIGEYIKNGRAVETGEMKPEELAVKAIDDKTLEVTLEHPTAYFLSMMGLSSLFAPLRQDIVEEYGKDFAADAEKNVYSGPYVLTSSANQKWIFEPNENYWDRDSIKLDRAEMSYVQNQSTALAMYEDGELDFSEIPSADAPNYEGQDESYLNGNVDYFYYNCDSENEAMKNIDFRLALNYAIDRNSYNELVNNGMFAPSSSLVFSGLSGVEKTYGEESTLEGYPMDGDEAKAKEHLEKALSALGKKASDITVTITTTDSESAKKQAEVCQEMWKTTLGINVEVNQVTYAETLNRQASGEYEIAWGGWGADYDDPYTYLELFKSDSPYNYSKYKNDEVDKLLTATQTETDVQKRMDMLHEVEQILIDEAAFFPQAEREVHYLVDDDVQGLNFFHCSINLDWVYADIVE